MSRHDFNTYSARSLDLAGRYAAKFGARNRKKSEKVDKFRFWANRRHDHPSRAAGIALEHPAASQAAHEPPGLPWSTLRQKNQKIPARGTIPGTDHIYDISK